MHLTVYLLDSWAQSAMQGPHALLSPLFEAWPALRRARWSLQAGTPGQHASQQLYAQPALHNACAAWLAASVQNQVVDITHPSEAAPLWALTPVSLAMQRDSFSLQGVRVLPDSVYATLTQTLQHHFAEDWQLLSDPQQRGWWVRPNTSLQAYSPWPADCLFQSAFAWQPQGEHARQIRGWSNEIQMLLHDLQSSVPDWPEGFNSLWLASVPELPSLALPKRAIGGAGRSWQGLCATHGLTQHDFVDWLSVCQSNKTAQAVWLADDIKGVNWPVLQRWASKGLVTTQLVLPFAEQTATATLGPYQRWQWWRKAQTAASVIEHLHAQLPQQRTPA